MNDRRRVVITGLGVVAPTALGIEPFWDGLIQKSTGVRRIDSFDPSAMKAQIAGSLPPYKLGDYIPKAYRKSAKVMACDIKIAVVASYLAVRDAGLITKCTIGRGESPGPTNVESQRFGANIGAGLICADLGELAGALATAADENGRFSLTRWGAEGMTNLTPLWLLKFLPNMLACHVTIVHDAQAPSNTLTCGEASSHLAIGEAFRTIGRGDADLCICGGAESKVNPLAMIRPQLRNRLNTTCNENPERASQPFAAQPHGMVNSEGGGLVILEELSHAQARGARIYGEVTGFGTAASSLSWVKPDEDGGPMARALTRAMSDAQVTASDVDLVAPFGSASVEHDAAEMAAWNKTFGDRLSEIPAMVTKGGLGNNGAGSGAIDFAATAVALHRNTVPPSLNTANLDPACRFRFVQNDPQDAPIDCAITLGTALAGGQSAALVIRKVQE